MRAARHTFFALAIAGVGAAPADAQTSSADVTATASAAAADLERVRTLIDEAAVAIGASDYVKARAKSAEAVFSLLAWPEEERDEAWAEFLEQAAYSALKAQDVRTANTAYKQLYELLVATLPDDHSDLQRARENLAITFKVLGDLAGARALLQRVLEVRSRTLPDDHRGMQRVRTNLGTTIMHLGDLSGARVLLEKVLEVYSRTLREDDPRLQRARLNLGATLYRQGDLHGARVLFQDVLEVGTRTLADDDLDLQIVRGNLAVTVSKLGDFPRARVLQEKVLEVRSRTLPEDDPRLQLARGNLAITLKALGDLAGARALQERVLEVNLRTLPEDHHELQAVRQYLALTLRAQGDDAGARVLQEKVLEVRSRSLPEYHPELQVARSQLARTLVDLGEFASAQALYEKALEVCSKTLPDDHPDLQSARNGLAILLGRQLRRAARMSVRERGVAERDEERERCAQLIGAMCSAQVHAARVAIVESPAREAEERCSSLARMLNVSLWITQGGGEFDPLPELEPQLFTLAETTRGAALASAELTRRAAHSPKYPELRNALRAASDSLAGLVRRGATSEEFDLARVKRESAERELVALAREISHGLVGGVEFDVSMLAGRLKVCDAAVSLRRLTTWRIEPSDEPASVGRSGEREVSQDILCAFVVQNPKTCSKDVARNQSTPATLKLVDLGPIESIDSAVRNWREALGVGLERGVAARASDGDRVRESGAALRRLVLDPLLSELEGAERVIVVLDDVLHLVPLDALPLDEPESGSAPGGESSDRLVGDRWRIETRATLTELVAEPSVPSNAALVALGGASFNVPAASLSAENVELIEDDAQPLEVSYRLRATPWERGFTPLTYSGEEVRGIGALYQEIYEDERPVLVLEKREASRWALEEVASQARFLHIATHGWFAPESVRSWSDPEPVDARSGLGKRLSGLDQVKGMSPMLLCGLALAGANLPENTVGQVPGLVTAEELSTLDLSNCELAVLSACDTKVGEQRAGQGVASLQKALQMAGARSVITSLWKVPDEATKELMLDFYRRLWVEKKPKWQALWEAKKKLREARDERGESRYTTRDWAAWVLTGDPE